MEEYDKFTTISNSVILVEFACSSDEDSLIIKARTESEKRPKTSS